jgi:hypothetical protein
MMMVLFVLDQHAELDFHSAVYDPPPPKKPRTTTKDYKIGICCFFAKHAALRRKGKDWLARNQDNVSEWGDLSTRGLLFQ